MAMMITYENETDPITGIPIVLGQVMTTLADQIMVNQPVGESPGGYNTQPGTSVSVPASLGGSDPGVPRGFVEVPSTGTLIANGRTIEES